MIAAALTLLACAQDGEADRIMLRFEQRRRSVRDETEYRRLLEDLRTELDAYARRNPRAADAPRAAFRAAETFLWARDPAGAEARLRRLLEDHPDCEEAPSARFLRGEILFQQEENAAAREAFEEFARKHPAEPRVPAARIYAAITLQEERRYEEAAEALLAVRRDFEGRAESWDALFQLAILHHVQERNDDARRELEEVIRGSPNKRQIDLARRHLTEYLNAGEPAPAGRAADMLKNEFCLRDHLGQVVVVYFFDPSAREAENEAEFLRRLWDRFKGGDLRILGVSVNPDRRYFEAFRDTLKPGWKLFLDGQGLDGPIARILNVRGLPWLLVVDRRGRTRFFNVARGDLRNAVERLLAEKRPGP